MAPLAVDPPAYLNSHQPKGHCLFVSRLDSTTYRKSQALGVPLMQWDTMIADDNGRPVPIGAQGEICCRGWDVMLGYCNMDEATDAADAPRDGWISQGARIALCSPSQFGLKICC